MLNPEFKLLNAFLQNPSKELYGRQIERLTETNHERALVYLGKLVTAKVLIKEKKGKQMFYRLNKPNEIVLKALSMAELERKIEFIKKNERGIAIQHLVSELVEATGVGIYFVVVFGSVARGQAREASDIDFLFVLLQNGKTKSKIEGFVRRMVIVTGERLSFHSITLSELERRWLKEPVYKNIWDERIVFFGEENFWKFVLRRGEPHG
jgi:predicted nucleotidyltransferase